MSSHVIANRLTVADYMSFEIKSCKLEIQSHVQCLYPIKTSYYWRNIDSLITLKFSKTWCSLTFGNRLTAVLRDEELKASEESDINVKVGKKLTNL